MSINSLNRKFILRIVLLAVATVLILLIGWYWYVSTHPLSNSQYGFQYYNPSELPAGFNITAKRIDILSPDGKLIGISAEMNLRTQDWVYDIHESKVTAGEQASVVTNLNNYDPTSVGVTCRQATTKKGQVYRLCHWIDYGRISVYEIKFIKGGTFIESELPGLLSKVVPISQINSYVDSFVKAKATGFTILSGGP